MSHIVGIDLGTTNSAVGIMRNGKPSVITTVEGKQIPSVVAFSKNGERLIGQAARQQAALNPENTVFSVKRFLGRRSEEEGMGVECSRVPYEIVNDGRGGVYINLPYAGRKCSPPEIAALILSKLKKEAEAYLGEPIEQAVLTVPAYFNDSQRQAVKEAGRIAGMEILRIINEPTAAALAYGQNRKQDEVILVCDLGGGTYDVSVLEVADGLIAVRASSGDSYLGGEDWDTAISNWIIEQFLSTHGVDLAKNRRALQRIKEAAERAKIELSTSNETEIFLPFIVADGNGPKHLRMNLSREKLEALTAPLLQRLEEPLRRALLDAGLAPDEIDAVVLVGGMSRMPAVQEKIRTLTGQEPSTKVNPDEVVVLGAALQAGLLSGQVQDVRLRDVTPLSLGLETMGGMMSILIPRNTTIPARRSEVFSTAEDGQTEVNIHVLQGERPVAADNNSLGIFRLEGIRPAPRGIPQIEVTFEIDADGILHVSARDLATGSGQTVTIATDHQLSDREVQRMVEEAQEWATQDEEHRELISARAVAQQIIYQTERSLAYLNGQTSAQVQREINSRIAALETAVATTDIQRIRRLTRDVQEASMVLCPSATEPQAEST